MSTNRIFAEHAPAYHKAGLPVIPLYTREKKPCIPDWSRYFDTKVDQNTSEEWVEAFPTSNVGLVLGPAAGLLMIDIDIDDKKIYNAIMDVLPYSPWHRRGKKGMMLAYKWSPIKTCRIKNLSNQAIVEILSSRTQCVLPPSIHPDTQEPYSSNVNLLDVLDEVIPLPDDIETRLRQALTNAGVTLSHSGWSRVTEYVAPGSRDTTLTEMAGLFAYAVIRGERTLKEAIGMLRAYHAEFIENTSGDIVPCEKHINNLIQFLHHDVLDKGKILPKGWDEGLTQDELKAMGVTLTSEDTEWDFETIEAYLHGKFEEHIDKKNRAEWVEKVLLKISKSNQLTKIDIDRILKYIVDVSGLGVGIATLRARLKELKTGDIRGGDHSEIARAVVKDLENLGLFRYHGEKFMKWGGAHWGEYDKNQILIRISQDYGHLEACKKNSDIKGILNIVSFLLPQGIQTQAVEGVNFANGFLTQELKLIPHNPDYGMTYTLPFRYLPEEAGRFPQFHEFLDRCWGKDQDVHEKIMALQEAICVTLFGMGSKMQRAVLLHGAPSSGKTQLLRIVSSILPGEAQCAVPPDEWDDRFLPAQLHNKLLNICGELSEKRPINGQKFKDIIDGSDMSAQHKNQQVFKFKPKVTHWFASNHMPKTRDTSSGFIRRWLLLTFHYPVKATEKKLDIGDQIAGEEREAIASWAAQAMPRLLVQNDFTLPPSHVQMASEFANVTNSVRFYLKESGKVKIGVEDGWASEVPLYNSYWAFCHGAGGISKPAGYPAFRAMMRELSPELGFQLKITQARFGSTEAKYEGMSLIG